MNWKTSLMPAMSVPLCVVFERFQDVIFRCTYCDGGIHFSTVSAGKNSLHKKNRSTLASTRKDAKARQSPAPAPPPVSSRRIPSTHPDIINSACDHHEADPTLVYAKVKIETGFY